MQCEKNAKNINTTNEFNVWHIPFAYVNNHMQKKKENRSPRHLQHTQISSNSFATAADNSTGTYIILYSIELIAFSAEYTLFNSCNFNPLNPESNPICYLLALLGAHHFLHVSRIRVKLLTFRLLMSYIYGAPILDVSRSHTTTQHSR